MRRRLHLNCPENPEIERVRIDPCIKTSILKLIKEFWGARRGAIWGGGVWSILHVAVKFVLHDITNIDNKLAYEDPLRIGPRFGPDLRKNDFIMK